MTSTTHHPVHHPARTAIAVTVAVACGSLVALQSRINGQLSHELGDGFVASVISFGSGLILLSIIIALAPRGRRGLATVTRAIRAREMPWFYICGGLAGGLFVLSQGLTAAALGVALFTIAVVAGQTLSGLALDSRGLGTVAPKVITPARIVGAVLALVAVGIAVAPQLRASAPFWMLAMPFLVGLLLGWQQAVNGQVKSLAESALTATFINFAGGTAILILLAAVHVALAGFPASFPTNPILYVGGMTGMIFIAGFAAVTPIIGVLLQSLGAVAGQLLMSLVLDIVVPTPESNLAWTTVLGTILTLVAVLIASLSGWIASRAATRGAQTT